VAQATRLAVVYFSRTAHGASWKGRSSLLLLTRGPSPSRPPPVLFPGESPDVGRFASMGFPSF